MMPKFKRNLFVITLLLALVIGAGVFIWAQNQSGDGGIPPASDYAPNFWFDKDEKYFPTDPLKFFYDEDVQELPGAEAKASYDKLSLDEKLSDFTVFYKIDDMGSEIVYEYWLFYVFNYGSNEHYGDWEFVEVFVDKNSQEPTKVIGSAHIGTLLKVITANNELLNPGLNHTTILIEEGSHANAPDGNNDGLFERFQDLSNGYNAWGIRSWSEVDRDFGPKIPHDSSYYHLVPLGDLQDKLNQNDLITKSETLGSLPFKTELLNELLKKDVCNPCYVVPIGGEPPEDPWDKPEYANPYKAQPLTKQVVTNWVGGKINSAADFASAAFDAAKAASKAAYNSAKNAASNAAGAVGGAINSLVKFANTISPAGISPSLGILPPAQVTNVTGGGAATMGMTATQVPESSTPAVINEYSSAKANYAEGERLRQMQNQLDDIAEHLDMIQAQIAALQGKPAVLGAAASDAASLAAAPDENQLLAQNDTENDTEPQQDENRNYVPTTTTSGQPNPPPKPTYPQLLISEVHNDGTNEFVEIFNPNDSDVDLTDWYLQKVTEGGGLSTYASAKLFEGQKITGKGYFLVARNDTFWPGGVGAYTDYSLGDNNTLILKNPDGDIVDKVGWGQAQDYEGSGPAPAPVGEQSIGRRWDDAAATYIDTDDNAADFELQPATSNARNESYGEEEQSEETPPPAYPKILISEVKAEGKTNKDEYIELYNTATSDVDLTGWALKKKTSSGTESNLVSASAFSGTISAGGYFLIVPQASGDQEFYTGEATPDLRYSGATYSFANDNTILLYNPLGEVVDKAGFGSAQDWETVENASTSPAVNPTVENSIGRIWDEATATYIDTDNNAVDFELQMPTPKALNVSPEPEPEPESLPQTVVINEVAWMGTKASPSDEWIELYNNTDQEIDIAGWRLVSSDVTPDCGSACGPDIVFGESPESATVINTVIPAGGYYLIERTDDNTTSEPADWFGSFGNGLDNEECEILYLYDAEGALIDMTACGSWPAGNNDTKQTMERIVGSDSTMWADNNLLARNGQDADGNPINGTPGQQNSVSKESITFSNRDINLLFDELEQVGILELTLSCFGDPCLPQYNLYDGITVPEGKTLRINPGVYIDFDSPAYMQTAGLYIAGTLLALGSEDAPITFIILGNRLGAPCGIEFAPSSTGSELSYVNMEKASCVDWYNSHSPFPAVRVNQTAVRMSNVNITSSPEVVSRYFAIPGVALYNTPPEMVLDGVQISGFGNEQIWLGIGGTALVIQGGNPTIENSTFSGNTYGIRVLDGSSPTIRNNRFENNSKGLVVSGARPIVEQNTFTNNRKPILVSGFSYPVFDGNILEAGEQSQINGIVLADGAGISENYTLSADSPFVVEGRFTVQEGATLTIAPGTIVKFNSPNYVYDFIGITSSGSILVQGAEGEPVVFTSLYDDDYGGDTDLSDMTSSPDTFMISLDSGGAHFDYALVRYGGRSRYSQSRGEYGAPEAAVIVRDGVDFSLANSRFEKNIIHLKWSGGGEACAILGTEDDFNSFDSFEIGRTIICE